MFDGDPLKGGEELFHPFPNGRGGVVHGAVAVVEDGRGGVVSVVETFEVDGLDSAGYVFFVEGEGGGGAGAGGGGEGAVVGCYYGCWWWWCEGGGGEMDGCDILMGSGRDGEDG